MKKDNPLSGKYIAVTGATGMLGAELVRQLIRTGATIRLVVRSASRLEPLFISLKERGEIGVVECELVNPFALREAFADINIVFHCAAKISFHSEDRDRIVADNTDITHHVVNACLETGVGRLVHVSSVAALGEPNADGIITANSFPDSLAAKNGYFRSKFYSENEVWRGIRSGLKATIVNPSVILGPGNWKRGGSAALFAVLASGIPFYVSGKNGYVDIRDVAEAMILLSTAPEAVNRRFILNGVNLSHREFITSAAHSVGKKAPRWSLGEKSLNRIQRMTGWWANWTGKRPLLTEDLVKAALSENHYDGEAIKGVIDFEYRPVGQTMQYMAAAYLKDKKTRKQEKYKKQV